MGRRLLLNLLLGVVAIALALFITLRSDQAPESGSPTISGLDPDTVSSIHITRLQGAPLAFSKRHTQWVIEGEPELPADDFQINTVLALPGTMTDRHYPADTLDLATMGLLPPQASAVLDGERFDLGTTDPLDKRRYVLVGTTVYLVSDRFQHLLNARYTNFVERRLLPGDAVVTGLSLPGLTLRLADDNHWQLQPAAPDVGTNTIRALINNWENGQALYLREYDGSTGESIQLHLKGIAQPVELVLLTREPEIILARPDWGIQYHLPRETGTGLLELITDTEQ